VTSQWSAERIFDELRDRGYDGGRTVLKEHVRRHRPRPKPLAEARFFVKPGQQMQVDWGEMGIVSVGGVPRKVYAFVAVLAWSRPMFVRFTTDMQLLTWLDCHYRAFTFFGGVPAETLIDNLKTGVLSRAGGTVYWHPKYEELAVNVGFRPLAHFPMRPKTKGRVERMVAFVRGRFFVGRDIIDLAGLNAQATSPRPVSWKLANVAWSAPEPGGERRRYGIDSRPSTDSDCVDRSRRARLRRGTPDNARFKSRPSAYQNSSASLLMT
jgi:transposase